MEYGNKFSYKQLIECAKGLLFGEGNAQLPHPPMLMFDRISNINKTGGEYKKGEIMQAKGGEGGGGYFQITAIGSNGSITSLEPAKFTVVGGNDVSVEEYVQSAMGMIPNTAPFNSTHHPAMAVPCGMSDGLPVSLMLIGKHFDESSIYRVASAFEQATDWQTM